MRCNAFLNSFCLLCFSDENSSTKVELIDSLAATVEDIIFYIYGELLCSTKEQKTVHVIGSTYGSLHFSVRIEAVNSVPSLRKS